MTKSIVGRICILSLFAAELSIRPAAAKPAALDISPVVAPPTVLKPAEIVAAERGKIRNTLAELPLSFEPNRGQSAPNVRFLTRAPGYLLQLTSTEMRLIVKGASELPGRARMARLSENCTDETAETPKARPHAVKLTWLGANRNAEVAPESSLPGTVNYFKGSDSSMWHTNIPTFKRVRYKEMYPGIDVVYHGNGRQLEYDLIVAPGADPTRARLILEGAEISLTGNGDLDLTLSDGRRLQLRALVAYQERDGERLMVEAHYRLSRHGDTSEIALQLAAYDAERPLIIDPLIYSTFLGGSDDDRGFAIAVNAAGEAFVTGETYAGIIDFPTTVGAFSNVMSSQVETFVTKLNAAGSGLVYSTFLEGSGAGFGIAVNAAGEAFVTGETATANFPTTPGAFDTTQNGGWDAFVAKLNAAGSALVYSTFLGGSGDDGATGIAVNVAGEAFVTGKTEYLANGTGIPFPTTAGAFDTTNSGLYVDDAFVAKLSAAGSALVYSTFLGGSGRDSGHGIAVDSAGEAFVTGETESANFPTPAGAFSAVYNGNGQSDAFVAKVNAAGSALVYSTFLGGSEQDDGWGIAVNTAGEAFVTGETWHGVTDFPTTPGAFSTVHNGQSDAFVAKLNAAGSALVYSTFLGGSGMDAGLGIAVNAAGEAFVIGGTVKGMIDFPTTSGAIATTNNGNWDVFVTRLNSTGSALLYSTLLGGSGVDEGYGIAVNSACEVFVTGETVHDVTDFPITAGALSTIHNGVDDAFVAKIDTGKCCVQPPSGMVAWYPLDELSGAVAVNDIAPPPDSTVHNDGTPKPGGSVGFSNGGPNPVSGMVGGALYFVTGIYAEVPTQAELDFGTADFSIDAWVRPVDCSHGGGGVLSPIVDKIDGTTGTGFSFYLDQPIVGIASLYLDINNSTFVSSGTIPTLGSATWSHLAVTVARPASGPAVGTFYINGSPAGTFTPPAGSVTNTLPMWIGELRVPGGGCEIAIDELELFNRALAQQEIQDIADARSAGKCIPCPTCRVGRGVAPVPPPVTVPISGRQ